MHRSTLTSPLRPKQSSALATILIAIAVCFVGDAQAQTFTTNEDGRLNVQVFNIGGGGGATDTSLNTTNEAIGIWDALDGGAGPTGPVNVNSVVNYNFQNVHRNQTAAGGVINYGGGATGNFGGDNAYGTIGGGLGGVDFAVRARAFLQFTSAGTFSISAGSDDGRESTLTASVAPGYSGITGTFNQLSSPPTGGNTWGFNGTTGHNTSTGAFTVSAGDVLQIESSFFERGGGDSFELSIRNGSGGFSGNTLLTTGALGAVNVFQDAGLTTPGFLVDAYNVVGGGGAQDHDINSNTESQALWSHLDANPGFNGGLAGVTTTTTYNVLNNTSDTEVLIDYAGGGGNFPVNNSINTINGDGPGGGPGPFNGGNNYSIDADAFLLVPEGTWSIAAISDDGRRVELDMSNLSTPNFTAHGGQIDGGSGAGTNFLFRNAGTGHAASTGVFTVAPADSITNGDGSLDSQLAALSIRSLFYQGGGGHSYELAIKAGADTGFGGPGDGWQLLQDNTLGWQVSTTPITVAFDGHIWDANGTTAGSGNVGGNWSDQSWTTFAPGTDPTGIYNNNGLVMATFSAGNDGTGSFSINVDGNFETFGLSFEEGTVITLNGAGTLNLTDPQIDVNTGTTAAISANLTDDAGAGGLTKTGGGTLNLSGTNTIDDGNLQADGGTLLVSGGTTTVGGGNDLIVGETTSATFNQTGGTVDIANGAEFGGGVGGDATATLSGGTLNTGDFFIVGGDGDATVTVSGGDVNVGSDGIVDGSGTAILNVSSGSFDVTDTLIVGEDGAGNVVHSGGTVTATDVRLGDFNSSSVGNYTMNSATALLDISDDLFVGDNGTGTLTQTAGIVDVADDLFLAETDDSLGTYNISGTDSDLIVGGNAIISDDGLGVGPVAGGTLNISAGADVDVSGHMDVGNSSDSTGRVTLNGAASTLDITGTNGDDESLVVGNSGTGDFDQNAGTVNSSGDVNVGNNIGAVGTYDISGGSLLITGGARDLIVGDAGTGTFSQSGASLVDVADDVEIGNVGSGVGDYTIGGTATLNVGDNLFVGDSGDGTLTQNGDSLVDVTDDLDIGNLAGSTGIYTLNNGTLDVGGEIKVADAGGGTFTQFDGTVTVNEDVLIGDDAGVTGVYTISGGTLNVDTGTSDLLIVGVDGVGDLNVDGGTIETGDLIIAQNAGSTGTLDQTGGTINVNNIPTMIVGDAGTATVNHSGGTTNVAGDLILGNQGGSSGTYNLSGTGLLDVEGDVTVANDGTGTFVQTGGEHFVDGQMGVGNVAGAGSYGLSGGLLDFEDSNDFQSDIGVPTTSTLTIGPNGAGFTLEGSGVLRDVTTVDVETNGGTFDFDNGGGTFVIGSDVHNEAYGGAHQTITDITADGVMEFESTFIGDLVTNGTLVFDIIDGDGIASGEGFFTNGVPDTNADTLVVTGSVEFGPDATVEGNWLYDVFAEGFPLFFFNVIEAQEGFVGDPEDIIAALNLGGDASLARIVDDPNSTTGGQFLQIAAPEPTTIAIWTVIGLGLFGGYARRRRKQKSA